METIYDPEKHELISEKVANEYLNDPDLAGSVHTQTVVKHMIDRGTKLHHYLISFANDKLEEYKQQQAEKEKGKKGKKGKRVKKGKKSSTVGTKETKRNTPQKATYFCIVLSVDYKRYKRYNKKQKEMKVLYDHYKVGDPLRRSVFEEQLKEIYPDIDPRTGRFSKTNKANRGKAINNFIEAKVPILKRDPRYLGMTEKEVDDEVKAQELLAELREIDPITVDTVDTGDDDDNAALSAEVRNMRNMYAAEEEPKRVMPTQRRELTENTELILT